MKYFKKFFSTNKDTLLFTNVPKEKNSAAISDEMHLSLTKMPFSRTIKLSQFKELVEDKKIDTILSLNYAAKVNRIDIVKYLAEECEVKNDIQNHCGVSPVMIAAVMRQLF